jgi:cation transport ATPase
LAINTSEKTIPIVRMDCPTCIPVLEREVLKLEGVERVRGNYMTKTLKVTYDPSKVQLSEIEAAIENIGYRISYKKYPSPLSKLKDLFKSEKDSQIRSLTDSEFPGKVFHASKDVAVLFSSPNCPTCQVFKSEYQKLAEELKSKADFYEMDINSTNTWKNYDILSIPTVLLFRVGKVFQRFTALPETGQIAKALEM